MIMGVGDKDVDRVAGDISYNFEIFEDRAI
jgi:hypothetical protein